MAEKRYTQTLAFKKGLDRKSLPFEGDPSRASDELNYIYKNGCVSKRDGCEGVLTFDSTSDGKNEVNGIWSFKAKDGKEHVIAHVGTLLYELKGFGDEFLTASPIYPSGDSSYVSSHAFENYKSSAFVAGNELYFLGGNKYMRLGFATLGAAASLLAVSSCSDVYIPTTTISITDSDSGIASRASLDDANLMTKWRWNEITCRSEEYIDSFDFVYELDSPLVMESKNDANGLRIKTNASEISRAFKINELNESLGVEVLQQANGSYIMTYRGEDTDLGFIEIIWVKKNGVKDLDFTADYDDEMESLKCIVHQGYYSDGKFIENFKENYTYDFTNHTFGSYLSVNIDMGKLWFDYNKSLHIWASIPLKSSHSYSDLESLDDFTNGEFGCVISGMDIDIIDRELYGSNSKTYEGTTIPKGSLVFYKDLNSSDHSAIQALSSGVVGSKTYKIGYATSKGSLCKMFQIVSKDSAKAQPDFYSRSDAYIIGYIPNPHLASDEFDVTDTAKLHLLNNYIPYTMGNPSVRIKFPVYVQGNEDKINKCRFGMLFGNSNAKNRLFLSGNPDFPNCDWHSSELNEYANLDANVKDNGNLTYFSDMDYCFYGQTNNEVMGYDIISTDKMVVFKSESDQEPSYYFRSASYAQALDASGLQIDNITKEQFSLSTGNKGIGAMNKRSVANLNGDTLVLTSDKKICGLDIDGIVGDSQRVMTSRSRYIDDELKELDLANAWVWSDGERFALVCDDRIYLTNSETFDSETRQYEWFKIGIANVTCLSKIKGVLHFGTKNGKIMRFNEGSHVDISKEYLSKGNTAYVLNIDPDSDYVSYNSNMANKVIEKDDDSYYKFKLIPTETDSDDDLLYRHIVNISRNSYKKSDFTISPTSAHKGRVMLNPIGSNGSLDDKRYKEITQDLSPKAVYRINKYDFLNDSSHDNYPSYLNDAKITIAYGSDESDLENDYVYLILANDCEIGSKGDELDLTKSDIDAFSLVEAVLGYVDVVDVDLEGNKFRLSKNGRDMNIVEYHSKGKIIVLSSAIRHDEPVKSWFICNPSTLGSLGYRKTIWSWTTTAPNSENDLEMCKATNSENLSELKSLGYKGTPIGLSFYDLSFKALDFEKGVLPRKFTYSRPLSVPFISFAFKSDKGEPSTLTTMSIVYTVPSEGFGKR